MFEILKSKYNVPLYNIDMFRLKITFDYLDFEMSRGIIACKYELLRTSCCNTELLKFSGLSSL
ncbi:MAG: hypothetical protein NC485_03045 [Ruminococcus flavefaciens]|nr:hypothetical protein [Ruminococcus flavefaciens]